MTLVLKRSLSRPGTHALVVSAGVREGEWHTPRHRMINAAAQRLVAWLATRYRNPTAEIATIDVYLNGWVQGDLDDVPGFTNQHSAGASHQSVEAAAETWMKRANAFEENIALFFFAGRVFDRSPDTALAFEDFRSRRWMPSLKSGTASFLSIPAAMRGCRARRQLYLLDVDREDFPQEARVELLLRPQPGLSPAPDQAIIYSASAGQRAFHEPETGAVPAFVPSLTQFLDSAEPSSTTGAISVGRLAAGVAERMRALEVERGIAQRIEFESTSDFDFHYPSRPGGGLGLMEMGVRRESAPLAPSRNDRPDTRPDLPVEPATKRPPPDESPRPGRRVRPWIARHRDSFAVQTAAAIVGGVAATGIAAAALAIARKLF